MNDLLLINQFVYIIVFFLGLGLGSFLNSWIWRIHENIKIGKSRSICPNCRRQLAWYENIPVFSYLVLLGKCRTCKNPIPKHFIFVEIITALIFVLVAWQNLKNPIILPAIFFRDIIFSVLLVIIFVYDWLYQEILPQVIWLGALVGLFFNFYFSQISLISMLIGSIFIGGFFLLQFIISKGKWIGGGDVRVGFMIGIWLGWPAAVVALFLSYISGAIVGLWLIFSKKKQFDNAVPFGTFLALGTFVSILWGNQIVGWYLKFLK